VALARRRETLRGALKLLRVLVDAARRHAESAQARHGVDATQLWALWELNRAPGLRAVELARNMAVLRQTAEQLLAGLTARGLVQASAGQDGLSPQYFTTAAGRRIADAARDQGQGIVLSALERLPDESLDQVVRALREVVGQLPSRDERSALAPLGDILRPVISLEPPPGKESAEP